jgi:hypothetical protein
VASLKQDRQCALDVISWRLLVTVVAMETHHCVCCLSVDLHVTVNSINCFTVSMVTQQCAAFKFLSGLLACLLHGAVVLENLTGLQLLKKFPAFYGTRGYITAFTHARHLSILSQLNPVHTPTSRFLKCLGRTKVSVQVRGFVNIS